MGIYDELLNNYDAKLIAGGAAQNTARGAQVYKSPSPSFSPTLPFPKPKIPQTPRFSPFYLSFFFFFFFLCAKTVHPPPFLRSFHRLRRFGQICRHPARSQHQSRPPC